MIDEIHRNNVNHENLGWEKGVYPSDNFVQSSLAKGELYVLTEKDALCACVILNSEHNEGYDSCTWGIVCDPNVLRGYGMDTVQNLRMEPVIARKPAGGAPQTSLRLLFSDLPDHQLVVAGGRVRFPGKGRALQLQQDDLRRGVYQAAGAQVSAQD